MNPLTTRASSTPMSRPLMIVPTTRPRSWGGARLAANGTMIWGPTVVTPTTKLAIARNVILGAAAVAIRAIAERDDKQQSQRIAQLRECCDEANSTFRGRKSSPDIREQGLNIIEVGNGHRTNYRQYPYY